MCANNITSGKKELWALLLSSDSYRSPSPPVHSDVQTLVSTYSSLFNPHSWLPPCRAIDHHIPLLVGTKSVNVCPYQYAHDQKAEIERQVDETLATCIIRPNSSSFSSPMILVSKKESTWHFCMDYCAFNLVTIEDRFLIPVIDELLDELTDATIFIKLNLHSGYHQI